MIQIAAGDIQDQLDKFFSKVIDKFILKQANKGKPVSLAQNAAANIEMGGPAVSQEFSSASMKVIEQTIQQEIDAL